MIIPPIVLGEGVQLRLFSGEVPTELIQLYCDWKSEANKTYLTLNLEDNIFVTNKMKTHILENLK